MSSLPLVSQLAACLPFVSQASGKSLPELQAMHVPALLKLTGEVGVQFFARFNDHPAEIDLQAELTFAELQALPALRDLFTPAKG